MYSAVEHILVEDVAVDPRLDSFYFYRAGSVRSEDQLLTPHLILPSTTLWLPEVVTNLLDDRSVIIVR